MPLRESVYVARQMILDVNQEVYGYELLFRDAEQQAVLVDNDLLATTEVLLNTMNTIGIQRMIGDKWAFVNVNEKVLQQRVYETLDRDRFVLELLETTEVSPDLVHHIKYMHGDGYTFALDDFVFEEEMMARFEPLFPYVSIVKVDLCGDHRMDVAGKVAHLKSYGMKFLAEKVESHQEFERCRAMGFDYFQGYFFSKPEIMEGQRIKSNYLGILELIHAVRSRMADDELEEAFKRYPGVTMNLLHFVNSMSQEMGAKVGSVRHAIDGMGRKRLIRWLMMMFYTNPNASDKMFTPLLELALQRARLMENVAKMHLQQDDEQVDLAFFTGILSLVDVIFQVPMRNVLEDLNVDADVGKAIQHRAGTLGKMLALVQAVEVNNLDNLTHTMEDLNLSPSVIHKLVEASYDNSYMFC